MPTRRHAPRRARQCPCRIRFTTSARLSTRSSSQWPLLSPFVAPGRSFFVHRPQAQCFRHARRSQRRRVPFGRVRFSKRRKKSAGGGIPRTARESARASTLSRTRARNLRGGARAAAACADHGSLRRAAFWRASAHHRHLRRDCRLWRRSPSATSLSRSDARVGLGRANRMAATGSSISR